MLDIPSQSKVRSFTLTVGRGGFIKVVDEQRPYTGVFNQLANRYKKHPTDVEFSESAKGAAY